MKAIVIVFLLAAMFLFAYHYNSPDRVATVMTNFTTAKVMPSE